MVVRVDETWTLPELVSRAATRIAALPAPANGQVRAVPDQRTVRYYATLGLLDRPLAMRGRTALYGPRHLAQVIAIKRLQAMGRSLAEVQGMWPSLDDATLARMSGVALPARATAAAARGEFWKRAPAPTAPKAARRAGVEARASATPDAPAPAEDAAGVELRVALAPHVTLTIDLAALIAGAPERDEVALSFADVRAIRAAAAPLLAELARRRLALQTTDRTDDTDDTEEEGP